ncbi:MAG: ribonuclease P protein component [Corynebacterium sp.]|nr:ribonuclease P protein component [Corynebacterium sp.]
MLPTQFKLTSPVQFRRVIKGGKRVGSRTIVMHAHDTTSAELAGTGPRFGLVVSKAVGNAVVRHRTSRRLRHICRTLITEELIPEGMDIVIRALPASGTASSEVLEKDVRSAWKRISAKLFPEGGSCHS